MAKQPPDKSIRQNIISMIAPASFGMLLTFLFQLVDAYFIGKPGSSELTAIGFAIPVYLLIAGLFMGTTSGISSAVGKVIDEGNPGKGRFLTTISQLAFIALTLAIGAAGNLTIPFVLSLLCAGEATIQLISRYMEVIYIGMFALVGTLVGNAALMAKGIMIRLTIIMAIGGVTNLIPDYLLIFGIGPFPMLELQGAALATAASWLITLVLMTTLLIKEELWSLRHIMDFTEWENSFGKFSRSACPLLQSRFLIP